MQGRIESIAEEKARIFKGCARPCDRCDCFECKAKRMSWQELRDYLPELEFIEDMTPRELFIILGWLPPFRGEEYMPMVNVLKKLWHYPGRKRSDFFQGMYDIHWHSNAPTPGTIALYPYGCLSVFTTANPCGYNMFDITKKGVYPEIMKDGRVHFAAPRVTPPVEGAQHFQTADEFCEALYAGKITYCPFYQRYSH